MERTVMGSTEPSSVVREQAFLLKAFNGLGINDLLFLQLIVSVRTCERRKVACVGVDVVACAGGLHVGITGVIEHSTGTGCRWHVHRVVRPQVLHAAIAGGILGKDVRVRASFLLQLLLEATETSTGWNQATNDHVLLETAH